MAGTIPLSMTQQFDIYGKPLKGGQLYIIQAGTVSTPQDAYVDAGLTVKQPYPMTLDAAGRVPQFFLADGSVKVRLQDAHGVVQLSADQVLVIGPSAGGGGGASVDQTQLIQTGMMMFSHTTAQIAGFVRLAGRTIGSSTSGATERNNQDCQALFLFIWSDPLLVVSGGRGASASADWAANKTISLPDWRSFALSALDDMGNVPAGRLTPAFFGQVPTSLGAFGGAESRLLTPSQCALLSHQHSVYVSDLGHLHQSQQPTQVRNDGTSTASLFAFSTLQNTSVGIANIIVGHTPGVNNNFTTTTGGANAAQAHAAIGPRKLVTFYMKL